MAPAITTEFCFSTCLVGDERSITHVLHLAGASVHAAAAAATRQGSTRTTAAASLFHSPPPRPAAGQTPLPQKKSDNDGNDDDTAPIVDVIVESNSGDSITCSLRGGSALHLCDSVIVVCDSSSESSVDFALDLIGRAGSDAEALPPTTPIVLLDIAPARLQQGNLEMQEQEQEQQQQLGDVAANFADMLQDLESVVRYVGSSYLDPVAFGAPTSAALVSVVRIAANGVRSPRHVLWDGRSLTEVGRQALRRAFWILDQDSGDGLLDDAEISRWHQSMYGTFSVDDIATMKAYARSTEDSYIAAGTAQARGRLITAEDERVTVLGFLAVCHIMLAEGRHEPLWVMLGEQGVGVDGRPYTMDEIEEAVSLTNLVYHQDDDEDEEEIEKETAAEFQAKCDELMLHLSPAGISFLSSLYSRGRFAHPSDLFLFTPDCPWSDAYGLPNACEVDLPVHDFVSCWRYMAVIEPATVAKFARYWGFAGDLTTMFVACKMRPYRNAPGDDDDDDDDGGASSSNKKKKNHHGGNTNPPPTAVYLVLGSPSCGKTSLMQRIADNDSGTIFADDAHPSGRSAATATVRARINNDGDVLIALRELDEVEVDATLASERFMNTVCGVVFCFDTSEPYSLSYLSRVYPRLAQCPNLPVVLVMCKADLPVVDQLGLPEGPRDFCVSRGIMWPPVFTSLSHLRALPTGELLNDVDNLTFILAEVAVNPRLVEEMAAAAQQEQAAATSFDDSTSHHHLRHSASSSGVGFFRAMKRATVVAALAVAAVKLGSVLWRKYEASDRRWVYPAVEGAAQSVQASLDSAAASAREWWNTAKLRPVPVALATSGGAGQQENAAAAAAAAGAAAAAAASALASSSGRNSNNNNSSGGGGLKPNHNINNTHVSTTGSKRPSGHGHATTTTTATAGPGPAQRRKEENDLIFSMDKLTHFSEGQPRPAPEHHRKLTEAHAKRSWAKHGEWK